MYVCVCPFFINTLRAGCARACVCVYPVPYMIRIPVLCSIKGWNFAHEFVIFIVFAQTKDKKAIFFYAVVRYDFMNFHLYYFFSLLPHGEFNLWFRGAASSRSSSDSIGSCTQHFLAIHRLLAQILTSKPWAWALSTPPEDTWIDCPIKLYTNPFMHWH